MTRLRVHPDKVSGATPLALCPLEFVLFNLYIVHLYSLHYVQCTVYSLHSAMSPCYGVTRVHPDKVSGATPLAHSGPWFTLSTWVRFVHFVHLYTCTVCTLYNVQCVECALCGGFVCNVTVLWCYVGSSRYGKWVEKNCWSFPPSFISK